ncbi:MAG: DUF61 family protein [Deltaproteobacteria bacterium]|nr:DUF61 family protein [Deltaproteobacteria bacterium]MBW2648471.1 DUF61 family protein [Deltaproteobacteria bacterium]
MRIDPGPDRALESCLKGDMKTLNAHLPRRRKTLRELQEEERPHVECGDGSTHSFRKKDLEYLAQMLDNEDKETLLLPIIIEVGHGEGRLTVRSKTGIEAKIFSRILEMPIACRYDMITIFKPQLQVLRRVLKTTTQYVFTT